jgi:2-dehydropantoate 2-reductase
MREINIQKIVVMGAGAVGCYFGGMLSRAGHDVTLIARPEHVRAIQAQGLYMDCLTFQAFVDIGASTELEIIKHADLILFCVKSPDTLATIELIKPFLKPDTILLSLQNGVDNCERIRSVVDNPVFPAVVYVATMMAGPGRLKHNGRGELVIGPWESTRSEVDAAAQMDMLVKISELLSKAAIPCPVSKDVRRDLWFKFLVNCSYNAISAIGQIEYGKMVSVDSIKELIDALADEVLAIAHYEQINMTKPEATDALDMIANTMVSQRSSTAQDLARKKCTEIDFLNGLVVRKGKQYGIPTPANQSVYALVKMLEKFNAPL